MFIEVLTSILVPVGLGVIGGCAIATGLIIKAFGG